MPARHEKGVDGRIKHGHDGKGLSVEGRGLRYLMRIQNGAEPD
jgi:hypothetical protein